MSDSVIIKVHPYNSEIHKRLMKEDPQYSEYVKNQIRQALFRRYHSDVEFREKQKAAKRERYKNDPVFRESVLEKSRLRKIALKAEKERLKAEAYAIEV
jgi:hypothetical protein